MFPNGQDGRAVVCRTTLKMFMNSFFVWVAGYQPERVQDGDVLIKWNTSNYKFYVTVMLIL